MTTFIHRIYLFVNAADQQNANNAAVALTGNGPDDKTFTVPLTTDGSTVVGFWASTLADDSTYASIVNLYVPMFVSGKVYVVDATSDVLTYTNSNTAQAKLATVFLAADVLTDLGLKTKEPN